MDLNQALRLRCSTRSFLPEQITAGQLGQILDAAQLAPIAGGNYSMSHITVIQDQELLDEIRRACMMHRKDGSAVDPLYGAPTLIMLSASGPSADHIEYCNVACAIENMALAATGLGLGSVYLWGYLKKLRKCPDVLKKLEIPEGYTPLSSIGVGYAKHPAIERKPEEKIKVNRL